MPTCRLLAAALVLALLAPPVAHAQQRAQMPTLEYPRTRTVDTVDVYHGTRVADPYRWLEDVGSGATGRWVERQNALTFSYLESIPERDALEARLTELWNYPKYGVPLRRGERYFFAKNSGLQNQSVWYSQGGLGRAENSDPEVLIDPNTLSEEGTVALSALDFSDDGRHVVYGTSASGSDWKTFRIRNTRTGEDLPEQLEWIKFSGAAWGPAGDGFYYGRYEKPTEGETYQAQNKAQKLYYHRLGTPQAEDRLVYARPDEPEWGFGPRVTDDGRYLTVSVSKGTDRRNQFYYKDLQAGRDAPMQALVDTFEASYDFVGSDGPVFYFLTDAAAPTGRLVAIDTREPEREDWRTLIPEEDGVVLKSAEIIGGRFVVRALDDVKARLTLHGKDGALQKEIELPGIGSVGAVTGQREDDEMFYAFTSYTYPTTIFRYDFAEGESEVFRQPEIPGFDPGRYTTRQTFYESKDGTRVPMFVVHRKGLERDGARPTYLYGYGGFNISITPGFSTANLVWLEQGGIFAVPNLRGGGEYGEAWHQAGMLENKQNVFDDFAWAAKHLIAEGYTSREKIAISGRSNGGLLAGASLTQRPDLFGAAVVQVGVLDMLRYHTFTIGWAWASEYGTADDPEQFDYLLRYSPLHNVEDGEEYPPTLVMTADTDDRVVPGHSYKFAATLQEAQAGAAPTLLRVKTDAGHGAGTPTSKRIQTAADKWAFVMHALDVETNFAAAGSGDEPAEQAGGR